MFRVVGRFVGTKQAFASGFHTSAARGAITKFGLPAMSPTMTEGTIHKWMKKEGETFAAGDVLLELETDKAQIDVEAQEDGVVAKILLEEGKKAPVNTPIALLAEEGDDLSNLEVPTEEPAQAVEKKEEQPAAASTPKQPIVASMGHHDLDTSKLKKPLSPAVLSLVLKHHIKDLGAIKASGPGGRILKGDVLAHLGLIQYKPAPKFKSSAAPPRDEIVIVKPAAPVVKKQEKIVLPDYISKQVVVDDLLQLRRTLNEQHRSSVSVNDFISKAATRALQDITAGRAAKVGNSGVVHKTNAASFSESYKGGAFKVFHLAPPVYDFITDSYESSKPYTLNVSPSRRIDLSPRKTRSADDDMMDLIGYLGGERAPVQSRVVKLTTEDSRLNFSEQPAKYSYNVELKLQGDAPGKILNDKKAAAFLDRVEFYIKTPTELVQ
ncbi:hypothetical protein DFQ28_007094 [Apophysomyces sp. BC1034]|nr:hypothetical protein DFQ30_003060 [Apophysomyces sp. BC1015]KAG0181027.1 hypothetical protein DFQ29_009561 [Apophysomyces sp. BC1021]KAG0186936.1 hypothetical protein DFQ28_007094 [Apophysomyces sp. BC1034]